MADKGSGDKLLYCSFCGKSQHEVRKLIAGPSVFICDECVELCNDIIREELEEKAQSARSHLPKPKEILEVLDQYVIGQLRALRISKSEQSEEADAETECGQENAESFCCNAHGYLVWRLTPELSRPAKRVRLE